MEDSGAVNAEAARWWSRVNLAEAGEQTRAEFESWRNARPAHAAAFARAEKLWRDLGDIGDLPEGQSLLQETALAAGDGRPAVHPRSRARRYLPMAAAALVLLALAPLVSTLWRGEVYSTQTAEVRDLTLSDGSRVSLGAHSRIDVRFTDGQRQVRLAGGEAFFDVRSNPNRPFVVEAGEASVRVLGTRFNVRRGVEETNIAVLDGLVEVVRSGELPRRLEANQRATLKAHRSTDVAAIVTSNEVMAPPGSWRIGRLSYDGTPLVEVIADVNRYYPPGVTLASKSLENLKVTTAFEVRQIGLMIDSLALALPLSVERHPDGRVVLAPKP